jgi:DNA-binding transcriptional ArsR family regulator/rhodanese-related sulfurtransferase
MILAALSAPVRLKLVHFLAQAPLSVEVLSQKIDQSVANTSMHLRKMLNENIVSVEQLGQKRLYSLHPAMLEFWEQSQDFIQKINPNLNLNVDFKNENLNWNFSMVETKKMIKNNEIILLDARPDDEITNFNNFENDIPYVHISANQIKENLTQLPKNKKILVICRGRLCSTSLIVTKQLRQHHLEAYRLESSWFAFMQHMNKGV